MSNLGEWSESTIVYHLYVRSFKDSNNDGIGDLEGVVEKLDYLADLGINAIWLSPIYPSPQIDFGYDIADYQDIDALFGDLESFKKLLEECHHRNIKLMMDFVPNHTSSKHTWFKESKSSLDNPKHDYYIWKEPKPDGSVPNNWLSVFGGSGWEYDSHLNKYYYHSFDIEQPDLNYQNPEVLKEMLNILKFWLDLGVDGFRVDAIEWMVKDPEFRDEMENPIVLSASDLDPYHRLIHTNTFALPGVLDIVKSFIEQLEQYPNKFLVTEVWSPMEQMVKLYEQVGRRWFTPFNFGLITIPWRADIHKEFIESYDNLVGSLYHPTYVLGNHDKPRLISRIGYDQSRVAAMLLLTLRGIPYIYYGEEIGMHDTQIPHDKIQDTFEKKSPGLGLGRDPERTPMQWNSKKFAGFSDHEPWLPVSEDFPSNNVEMQQNDLKSMLNIYKKLISLRKNSKALLHGQYESLETNNESVFAFTRTFENEIILVVLNYADSEQNINTPFEIGHLKLSTYMDTQADKQMNLKEIILRANEGIIVNLGK
jgi:alpha-glucosidase